jgi:hypothetical protein
LKGKLELRVGKYWKLFVWPAVFAFVVLAYLDWRMNASVNRLSKSPQPSLSAAPNSGSQKQPPQDD